MKIVKLIITSLIVTLLILSLILISCKSNEAPQESSEPEEVVTEAPETNESDIEKTEELVEEEMETQEIIEEPIEAEEEYDGLCKNLYFPVNSDLLWNYLVVSPSETYEYSSSFYDITDSSFTEKIESLVFNADIKWLCFEDGIVQSEYSALMLEEDDQGIEFTTESYEGITLPSSEKWVIGYKWDTLYKVRTTITEEGEQMTFTGDIIIKNEIVAIESVTVPAGTFPEAVKVDSDKSMNISADIEGVSMSFNAYTDISSWYVDETGLVKQVSQATCGTTTVELLSIEEMDE